jgi:hypothetical protein
MKKAVIFALFIIALNFMWAELINEDIAGSVAQKFYEHVSKSSGMLSSIKVYSYDAALPDLYVVNFDPMGYVLVAADDRSAPILGYAMNSPFPLDDLPAHIDWYLSQYSRSIAEIRQHPEWLKDPNWDKLIDLDFSEYDFSRNVSPLCATTWDQNWPYNSMCPADAGGSGGRVYAGCVATTMAQIMKKWNHPPQGQGSHSYNATGYGTQTANFGNTTYNWQNMPNSITQVNTNISTLIYHCGVAVDMDYSPDGSGAYIVDARDAMVNYFRYHESAHASSASSFSAANWATKLRTDLDASRPIIYQGVGSAGGHAFVLDGYQGTDYFHFNWGWSGYYDGYFYLNNLNPGSYDFSQYQAAITSIYPVVTYQNDLAATAISGEQMPVEGQQSSYQITVQNMGLSAQSNYTVQLYRDNGVLLSSVSGNSISAGATITYTLNWTPDVTGTHVLYGKVNLSSDQNPDNNVTGDLDIQILSADNIVIQLGNGTSSNDITSAPTPYGTWYKAFRQQYLILSSELSAAGAAAGDLSALGFNVANVNNCSAMPNYTIRLKTTNLSVLSSSFETGNYQTVCQYTEYLPSNGWNTHIFQSPFIWDGVSNILVDISADVIPGSYTQNASVYYTPTSFNSCLRFQSDSTNGINGTTGTLSTNRANMKLISTSSATEVTIGSGVANYYMPVNAYYGYSYAQMLYKADEIGVSGQQIVKLAYHWNGVGAAVNSTAWTIYMGNTNKTAFANTSDWIDINDLTQVYQGTVNIPAENRWIEIELAVPFEYNSNQNLVIAVHEGQQGYDSNAMYFYNTSSTSGRSLRCQSDSSNPNPAQPPTGSLMAAYPNIKMTFEEVSQTPVLAIVPNVQEWDFAHQAKDSISTKEFTIYNNGSGTLTLNNVSVSGTGFALQDAFVPTTLGYSESVDITVVYNPTAAGNYQGTLLITSSHGSRTVNLLGSCYDPVISQFPFFEGFELGNTNGSTAITQWEQILGTQYGGQYWTANSTQTNYNRTPRSGDWNITLRYEGESTLMRPIMLEGGQSFSLEFWARQDATTGATIKAVLGTNPELSGNLIQIVQPTNVLNGDYQQFYGEFVVPQSGLYYIGIYANVNHIPWYISLDDITIDRSNASEVLVPPNSLQATVAGANVSLTWNAPEDVPDDPADPQWITWCDVNTTTNAIGTNSAVVFDVAHRYDANDLAAFQGLSVSKMKFVPNEVNCTYTAKVWTGINASAPSTLVYSQVIPSPIMGAWNEVILNNPVPIPASGEIWIGYEVNTQGGYPAVCDGGPQVAGKGNMMYFNNQWIQLTQAGATLTYNWSIQAYVEYLAQSAQALAYTPIREEPRELVFGANFDVRRIDLVPSDRALNRAQLGYKVYRDNSLIATINNPATLNYLDVVTAAGVYSYTVTAYYDGGESLPAGPAIAEVTQIPIPIFAITPESHAFGNVSIGANASQQFTVSNAGTGTLTINSITISGAMMSLGALPTLPANLGAGQSLNFNAIYAPTAYGQHTGTISITDNLSRTVHTVALTGMGIDVLSPPTNLQASVEDFSVTLSWNAPARETLASIDSRGDITSLSSLLSDETRARTGYKVYRNNNLLTTINNPHTLTHIDEVDAEGVYSYSVTAVYDSGESAAAGPVEVEVSAPAAPDFAITPDSHNFGQVHVEQNRSKQFTISNAGGGTLTINTITINGEMMSLDSLPTLPAELDADENISFEVIYAPTEEGAHAGTITITDNLGRVSHSVQLSGTGVDFSDLYPPRNLRANLDGMDVNLFWNAPAIGNWIFNCNPDAIGSAFGTNSAVVFDVAHRHDTSALADYLGSAITRVRFVPQEANCIYTIKIWTGIYPDAPSALVYSQVVHSPTIGSWNTILLDTPVSISAHTDLWIGYECDTQTGYPAGCDDGSPFNGSGNMINMGGWSTLFELSPSHNNNWLIQAYVDHSARALVFADQQQTCEPVVQTDISGNARSILELNVVNNPTPTSGEISGETRELIGFNVYRDNVLLAPAGLDYIDTVPDFGTYSYSVTAVYDNGESLPAGPIEVTIVELEPPTDLSAVVNLNTVSLSWTIPGESKQASMAPPNPDQTSSEKDRDVILTGFKILRDDTHIATLAPDFTSFHDISVPNGVYEYSVSARYNVGHSSPATIQVTVNVELEEAVFADSFEEYEDFATSFEPWTLIDQDGSLSLDLGNNVFPGSGSAFAYMIFNPTQTVPPLVYPVAYEGDKMAASFRALTPPNDDYLITPQIQLGTNSMLRFYALSHTSSYGLERFKLGISTLSDPNILSGYNYISGDEDLLAPARWTEYYFDISNYDNEQVYITIHCISNNASVFYVDNFSVHTKRTSNDDEFAPALGTQLAGNYPNPFNPETTISYSLKEAGLVSIDIYNVKGQLIKHLVKGEMSAGNHSIVWNGRDDNNHAVSSGVYFYKMNSGSYSSTKKMIMMK